MASRTPPEIKWLLVERATLAGDIEQLARRQALLDAKMEALQAKVQALDTSIRLLDARVNGSVAGKIRRHCQQYGERGALKAFIMHTLRETEHGLSIRAVARLTAAHFGIEFLTIAELTRYCQNSIRPLLKELRSQALVENLPGTQPDGMLWRWKRTLPALADLARLTSLRT